MALNQILVMKCREKLIAVAKKRSTINYGDMAEFLGVANQSVGRYLTDIYKNEIENTDIPDLTAVTVYKDTGVGRFNSRGGTVKSVEVDPNKSSQRQAYNAELQKVYDHWSKSRIHR